MSCITVLSVHICGSICQGSISLQIFTIVMKHHAISLPSSLLFTCICMVCHQYDTPNVPQAAFIQQGPLLPAHLLIIRALRRRALEHRLWVPNPHRLALLHALQRERGDQRSPDTGAVFGRQDLDRVVAAAERLAVAALVPVKDFFERLRTASLFVQSQYSSSNKVWCGGKLGDAP